MLIYILQGIAFGFAAAVQPGAFQTYLISQTLNWGWRRALPLVFAPLLSDGPILVLVLFVLSRLPAWWVQALEIAGGGFVLYLAIMAWRAWMRVDTGLPPATPAAQRGVFQAALVNLLNPAPYLFWSLVTGPILLAGWREAPANGIGLLAAFYLTVVIACAGIILLFGMAKRLGAKVNRGLQLLSVLALGVFGLYHIGMGIWTYWRL